MNLGGIDIVETLACEFEFLAEPTVLKGSKFLNFRAALHQQ